MSVWEIDAPTIGTIGGGDDPVLEVSLVLASGRVDLVADDTAGVVRYEVQDVQGRPLWVSWDAGRLRLEQHKDPRVQWLDTIKVLLASPRRMYARIVLTVPTRAKVSVNSIGAEILVSGVDGEVSINTVTGRAHLSSLSGVTHVKTVSSDIDASGLVGELRSKTVSGALTVDASPLRSVKVATVSGAARLDLTGTSTLLTANAVSGDLTVRIPAGAGYDITAQSRSGHVVADGQPLRGENEDKKGGHRFDGDRAFAVKARSVSGDIVLLRGRSHPEPGGPVLDAGRENVQDVRPSQRDRPADGPGAGLGEAPPGPADQAGWERP